MHKTIKNQSTKNKLLLKNLLYKLFPFLNNEGKRELWVSKQLKKTPRKESIMDAGAGECIYKKYCRDLQYTSQDFCLYDGKGDNIGLQAGQWDNTKIDIRSDITDIPVKAAAFDNVLCTEVLEHIPKPHLAIKEFSRILKKGGQLILTAPFSSQTHFSPFHFHTGFTIYWYKKILNLYGFKIVSYERNGDFFGFLAQELLRLPLITKKYTRSKIAVYSFYLFILPIIPILALVSRLSSGSEKQLCFGYHILARKT